MIFRFDAPLFFANARTFREQVARARARRAAGRGGSSSRPSPSPTSTRPLRTCCDDLDEDLNDDGVHLVFAELKDPVRTKIDRYELTRTIDPAHFFPTLDAAVEAFQAEFGEEWRTPQGPQGRSEA